MFLGKLNRLVVKKRVDFGVYLDGKDWGDILLPKRYVPATADIGSSIEVFLYLDSEDQLIATTEKPLVKVGEVAQLRCVATTKVGAFLNWGLKKDLLAPFAEQAVPMQQEYSYLVYCFVDRSNRIVASTKLDKFIGKAPIDVKSGDEVEMIVADITDLGYKVVINHQHWGLLYKDQVFKPLKRGYRCKAWIGKVRDDGKLDVLMQKPGYQSSSDLSAQIMARLVANNGSLALSDKSSPDAIASAFGVSKKAYKQALGALLKEGKIEIEPELVRLKPSDASAQS